jgi:hypothetical protein
MLLFLRQLRRIKVQVDGQQSIELSKTAEETTNIGKTVDLVRNGDRNRYIIHTHTKRGLPTDVRRREDISESQILLGFPLELSGEPKISRQDAYAFLPIREYGSVNFIPNTYLSFEIPD